MTLIEQESVQTFTPADPYLPLVRQVLRISDVTWGDEKTNYLMRYRGKLALEAQEAYDQLAQSLRPLSVTPLFRQEGQEDVILLLQGILRPRPSNPWINALFFVLTVLSMLFAGTFYHYPGPITSDIQAMWPYLVPSLLMGLAFTASMLAILLAHEFGHYLAARYHRTTVTLPYFIPFPLSPFGTMGAFIQLKEPPKNKRILLDIGIAGPLAGLVVAIPVLILGLYLSQIDRLPLVLRAGQSLSLEGNSLLYLLAKYVVFGRLLPDPSNASVANPVLYWIQYFFTGRPVPFGGEDVMLHPIAWAGWAGLLITALNLIPAGQFDGGHLIYVLQGKRARRLLPFILVILLGLGFVWSGWWLWAFLIFLLGRVYAEPLDQITALDKRRKALAIFGLVVFVLVFTPIPLAIITR